MSASPLTPAEQHDRDQSALVRGVTTTAMVLVGLACYVCFVWFPGSVNRNTVFAPGYSESVSGRLQRGERRSDVLARLGEPLDSTRTTVAVPADRFFYDPNEVRGGAPQNGRFDRYARFRRHTGVWKVRALQYDESDLLIGA